MKIKNPLSLLIFCQRNIVKILPFLIIVLFSVFAIIVSYSIFNSLIETTNFYSNLYKKCAIINYLSNQPDPLPIIKKGDRVAKIYDIELYGDYIEVIFGEAVYPIIGVKKEDVKNIMRYFNVRLKSGKIFEDNEEVLLISEQIVKNKKYRIGKLFNRPRLQGYKIGGILEGETAMGLYPYTPEKIDSNNRFWICKLITFRNPLEYRKNAKFILKNKAEYIRKYNAYLGCEGWDENEGVGKATKKLEHEIGFIANVSILVSMVVFSLIAISLNIVYFYQRITEYGLLLSLGLSKFQIIKKSFWENFFVIFISWIFGLLLSRISLEIMNWAIFVERGWKLNVFPFETLPYTIIIPLSMLISGFLVIIYKIQKLDPIEIIERRW
jgi:ABC-type antimicrobial peptide transport system permease subunit